MSIRFRHLALAAAAALAAACSDDTVGVVSTSGDDPQIATLVANPHAEPASIELLAIAYDAVSAMPLQPHAKSRSRGQQAVADVWLQLDEPRRALTCIEPIADWRRGAGYADYAFWCAQHGDEAEARRTLELAARVAERHVGEEAQDWQRDRIRAGIARTWLWLGDEAQSAAFAAGAPAAETGRISAVASLRADATACDEQLAALAETARTRDFDQIRAALGSCARLFDRFYTDPARRERIERAIGAAWEGLPAQVRIEVLVELAGTALAHDDGPTALRLLQDARLQLDGTTWTPDAHVMLLAQLAGLRHRAGDPEGARRDADAALAQFTAERARIVDIDRADTLRPLAEAYQAMGDTTAALSIYAQAIEEGAQNPNSRPRAEDLSATCCSMALSGVTPDAALWARLRELSDGLGDPW
jgi:tetratricopeptide (TPR) repeat protein